MNDIGVNVAQVLDDLQASYMNNDEYVRMSRIEEYINSPKQGKIDLTKVLKDQHNDSVGFDDIWGNGIKMNWTLVPVEEQKPHINWRQAIDDDGSGLGRLASWYDINSGMTASVVNPMNNSEATNVYLRNQKAMDENKNNEAYSEYIKEGRELVEHKLDIARSDYENKKDAIKSAIGNTASDLDMLAVLAGAVAYETDDYTTLVSVYRQCETEIGCSNPVLVWIAVGTSSTTVRAYVNGTLSKKKDENDDSSSSTGSGSSSSSQGNTTPRKDPKTVLYVECVEEIKAGLEAQGTASTAGLDLFPKVCYLYVALMNDIKTSSFDGDSGWAFPFTDDIINDNGEKAVYVTGRYGEQRSTHQHEGVDLQTGDNYSNPDKDVPFVAVKDGTVMDVNDTNWCNCIYVAHPDGTFSRYLHCRRALVSNGQQVKKGEKIGIVGGSDGSNERAYPVHLHIEFGNQIAGKTPYEHTIGDNCGINPLDCWRKPDNNDATSGYPCWTL